MIVRQRASVCVCCVCVRVYELISVRGKDMHAYIHTHVALVPEAVPNAVEPQSFDDPRPSASHKLDS